MSVKIKNTADDRMKAHLHRTASKFVYEPSIGGQRLRLGETLELSDERYEQLKEQLSSWAAKGIIEILEEPKATPKFKVAAPVVEPVIEVPTPEPVVEPEPEPEPETDSTPSQKKGPGRRKS